MSELQEQVALVTGGSDGIGKEVARGLVRRGAQIVIVGRNAVKGRDAAAELNQVAGRQTVEFIAADLSLMREIRRLADGFRERYGRLHILVHSAGVIHTGFDLTEEGHETNFAIDYLSRFLLTHLLLDLFTNIAAARGKGKLDFEQMRRPTPKTSTVSCSSRPARKSPPPILCAILKRAAIYGR